MESPSSMAASSQAFCIFGICNRIFYRFTACDASRKLWIRSNIVAFIRDSYKFQTIWAFQVFFRRFDRGVPHSLPDKFTIVARRARGTGSPLGLVPPVEQGELVPLLELLPPVKQGELVPFLGCCCPWSKGNWFPFWTAAACGAGGTGSPFGLLLPVEQGELVPLLDCCCPWNRGNWFPFWSCCRPWSRGTGSPFEILYVSTSK